MATPMSARFSAGRIPADQHMATASAASGRGGSIMPTMPIKTIVFSACSEVRGSGAAARLFGGKPPCERLQFLRDLAEIQLVPVDQGVFFFTHDFFCSTL